MSAKVEERKAQCILDFTKFKDPTFVLTVHFRDCQYLREISICELILNEGITMCLQFN